MGKMADKLKKRAVDNKNKSGNTKYDLPDDVEKFDPGYKTYKLDFIPYVVNVKTHPDAEKGEEWLDRPILVHHGLGPEGRTSRICRRTINAKCPVCEERRDLLRSDDSDAQEMADKLKPKERVLYNVIDLDNEDKGPQLFDISYYNFSQLLEEEIRESEKDDIADFAELEGGKTVKVRFRKESFAGNPYPEASKIEFLERDDYDRDILSEVIDLDKILKILSYEELAKELHMEPSSTESEEEEEEEEESKPKKRKTDKKKSSKKKSGSKKEKEAEDDSEEEPKSKKGSKKKGNQRSTQKKQCPIGGEFGMDNEEYDECADCDLFVACREKWDELSEEEE